MWNDFLKGYFNKVTFCRKGLPPRYIYTTLEKKKQVLHDEYCVTVYNALGTYYDR